MDKITPDIVLRAYSIGLFPMAEASDDPLLFWVDPQQRGILPLDDFHIAKSLRKTLRRQIFDVRCDTAFLQVMEACAAPAPGRESTWINQEIMNLYQSVLSKRVVYS